MNHLYRFLYLGYVIIWLLNESKYLGRIDYTSIVGKGNYALIHELIIGNLLFGTIGLMISVLIGSSQKTNIYFICTCAIGLAVAAGTLYLDSSVTGNAGQAHMDSVLALFAWLLPWVGFGWRGIIKDLAAAIFKQHKKPKDR
ncbi:hypothetical protein [Chamaesiphon sp. VAR_69_metabat_338]|uniref:hypothetical protein n=1 Tax=Chamaesiphon sp. VAR_69_metabat_338 TaxID=2964704 RepID=UPI00286DCCE8|nr:hypothetical protein [Chamaesiphon sp. VAR_69_metabat_338]